MSLCLLKSWARDWKRTASIALGILLAVSLLVSMNVSASVTAAELLEASLSRVLADVKVGHSYDLVNWTQVSEALLSLEVVEEALVIMRLELDFDPLLLLVNGEPIKSEEIWSVVLVGIPPEPVDRLKLVVEKGAWNLSAFRALVVANPFMDVEPGDELVLQANLSIIVGRGPAQALNLTSPALQVSAIVVPTDEAVCLMAGSPHIDYWALPGPLLVLRHSLVLCVSYDTLLSFRDELERELEELHIGRLLSLYVFVFHYAWVDRSRFIDVWNLDATEERLDELRVDVEKAIAAHVTPPSSTGTSPAFLVSVDVPLRWAVSNVMGLLNTVKFITGIFSLPVFLLCWYLALTAGYLVSSAKRREIGLLRTRGISSRRVLATYLATSALLGLGGSFLGILAGLGLSMLYFSLTGLEVPWWEVLAGAFTPEMLGMELGLGVSLCVVAAIKPARFAAKLSPLEAAREYVEAEAVGEWKPGKLTLLALALGSVKIGEWLAGIDMMEIVRNAPPMPFFLSVALHIWAYFDVVALTFLGPLLFVYGLTKVITRSSKRLYEVASLLARPLKELRELVSRSLARNPARASRVALLISVALAYGIFTSVLAASFMDAHTRAARTLVGSDVRVEALPELGFNFTANLTQVEGVGEATFLALGWGLETTLMGHALFGYVIVNASALASIAYHEPGFCRPDMGKALAEVEESPYNVLITEELADMLELDVGDRLLIRPAGEVEALEGEGELPTAEVEVVGVLKAIPGFPLVAVAYIPLMLLDDELAEELDLSYEDLFFLVEVEPGADPETVAEAIEDAFPWQVLGTETVAEAMRESYFSMVSRPVYEFLQVGFAYSLVAAAVGLALTAALSVRERTYEVGLMRARGLRRRQVLVVLAAEALIIVIIGLTIGVFTGLVSASGIVSFISRGGWMGERWPIEVRMVLPLEFWLLLGLGAFLFVLASLAPALLAFRREVVETIRCR